MECVTELYLIRHTETVLNTQKHIVGGRSNETPHTELGVMQAQQLGRFLLREGIIPTEIHSSPAVRTLETTRLSLAEMGIYKQPIVDDDLQEADQGEWQGRLRNQTYTPDVIEQIARDGEDFKAPGGESMNEVGDRMLAYLFKISEPIPNNNAARTIFVFTHGLAIRCAVGKLRGWDHKEIRKDNTGNGSITLLRREQSGLELVYLGMQPE